MECQPAQVVVVGSCNIDLICYTPRLPKPGETIHGTVFEKGYGGKGANQCVMAAKLGARTAMVAKLGEDDFGHGTIDNFRKNGVNVDHVKLTSTASSGVAAITVDDKGENSIVIVSAANMLLSDEDVAKAENLITMAMVVVCQLEVDPQTTLTALKLARNHGVTTIFNPAPALKGLSDEFYKYTDLLCLNETEAEILLSCSVPDIPTGREAVAKLQYLGVGCVVLTMGERGVLYSQYNEGVWSGVEHVPAHPVEAVDTTGAGDAFVGALAYYLACFKGQWSLAEMLRRACVIAAHTVKARGTQSSYCVETLPRELLHLN